MRLRLLHNGNVNAANPHWHLWLDDDGRLLGEVIGRQSEFRCIQEFTQQLDKVETAALFRAAEQMRSEFSARQLLPDDIYVEVREGGHPIFGFAVPQADQARFRELFFEKFEKILEKYA
ncbi:MAG: hypothetical protein JWQ71_433 [Pedosphaera sp.]|nr:hypothetical protein [Pedosphaera sp.]